MTDNKIIEARAYAKRMYDDPETRTLFEQTYQLEQYKRLTKRTQQQLKLLLTYTDDLLNQISEGYVSTESIDTQFQKLNYSSQWFWKLRAIVDEMEKILKKIKVDEEK